MDYSIIEKIKKNVKPGTIIPKPRAKHNFIVKGFTTSKGEEALAYFVNNKNSKIPSEKRVTFSEFVKSYNQLIDNGEVSRKWYSDTFPDINYQDPCNFTTVGGIFILLKLAYYKKPGIYSKI
jgi:hypothetical protein